MRREAIGSDLRRTMSRSSGKIRAKPAGRSCAVGHDAWAPAGPTGQRATGDAARAPWTPGVDTTLLANKQGVENGPRSTGETPSQVGFAAGLCGRDAELSEDG